MTAHPVDALLPALRNALGEAAPQWFHVKLEPLADKGLAHHHVSLVGTGVLARIPKQSQLRLDAAANLAYQAACFDRASASGHAPRLHAILPPAGGVRSDGLPRGALLVEHIDGRPAVLPDDLDAVIVALARIHALPLPHPDERAPLGDAADPVRALVDEVAQQAQYLDAATLHPDTRAIVDSELGRLAAVSSSDRRPARRLISFDAHPGNFLIRSTGEAVLVDLEKCRYSFPGLDLAHATLYTSTTWEQGMSVALSPSEVAGAYHRWSEIVGDPVAERWHLPLRRAMWLWSVTWCAKWRVLSGADAAANVDGEDWASAHSVDALTAHVRGRVDHYLDPETVRHITAEFDTW